MNVMGMYHMISTLTHVDKHPLKMAFTSEQMAHELKIVLQVEEFWIYVRLLRVGIKLKKRSAKQVL